MRETFPPVTVEERLHVVEGGNVLTSAGISAGIDMPSSARPALAEDVVLGGIATYPAWKKSGSWPISRSGSGSGRRSGRAGRAARPRIGVDVSFAQNRDRSAITVDWIGRHADGRRHAATAPETVIAPSRRISLEAGST